MTPPNAYVVERREDGAIWSFATAEDLVTFMWGRDFTEYAIYRLFPWTDGDLSVFKRALEATQ